MSEITGKNKKGTPSYQDVFEAFKERFLVEKKSIFDLNSNDPVFEKSAVDYLIKNFVNFGLSGNASFKEKIRYQLVESEGAKNASQNDRKNAIEVLATAVWLWRLPPINTTLKGRESSVKEILSLEQSLQNISLNNRFFDRRIKGFASPGTRYNTSKPGQLAYIIKFFEKVLKSDNPNYIAILKGLDGKVSIDVRGDLSKEEKKESPEFTKRSINPYLSIHDALLHIFSPDEYEPILSMSHKKLIIEAYSDKLKDEDEDKSLDDKLSEIRAALKIQTGAFYEPKYREKWDSTIFPAKNIIYYGAPGTGKTYQVTELIKRKTNDDSFYYKIQQFHPSFGYEDFIDGIKPIGTDASGNMKFGLVNGEFKELCIRAFKELVLARKENREAKEFYYIADEINRAELSRVFGELLLCLEEDKRLCFDKSGKLQGTKIKTQNSKLWKQEHAVVVLDEKGDVLSIKKAEESNDLAWDGKGKEFFFGVPENLYFLGTMNDIDRSIDSFDLALRRRFKWIRKDCDYDVITEELLSRDANDETIVEYLSDGKEKGVPKGRCRLLNSYISDTLNLGSSYELGHSYFMKIEVRNGKIAKSAYERLFDLEIGSLVTEYLRAEYPSGKELETKLNEMRRLFTEGNQ